jgi:hypothetical protein
LEELQLVTRKELVEGGRNFSWSFRLLFCSVFLLNHILLLILLFLLILHILIVLIFFHLERKIQMLKTQLGEDKIGRRNKQKGGDPIYSEELRKERK